MATLHGTLTLAEFEREFAHQKPYYEFWDGEAIQKSMPTWVHGLLQRLIMELLQRAGYIAASEVKLKIKLECQPVPDIVATTGRVELPYPTKPLEVVVEILSDDDPMPLVLRKCRAYQDWGFPQIYVVDPCLRLVFRWSEHRLEEVDDIAGEATASLWAALDQALQ